MKNKISFRIGNGFDFHAFKEGSGFYMGGIQIPFHKSLKAHSDGDVLLHSIANALLGSLALGDLGSFYPSDNPIYKGMRSSFFLNDVYQKVKDEGYQISNLDSSIICELPKIQPYVKSIRDFLSETLLVPLNFISVKAVTTEKMGALGRSEGIAAFTNLIVISENYSENIFMEC